MYFKFLSSLTILIAFLLISWQNANAQCDCATIPICQYYKSAVIGFGKENRIENGKTVTVFQIEKSYNPDLKDEIIINTELTIGQRYLLFPHKDEKTKNWKVFGCCSRDKRIEEAAADLKYLEKIEKEKVQNRVSGTIRNYLTQLPVSTLVEIIGENQTHQIFSDKAGVYEIYNLPEGNYKVRPKTPADLKIRGFELFHRPPETNELELDIKDNSCYEINVLLEPDNKVSGRVFLSNGEPLENFEVRWLRSNEVLAYLQRKDAQTDGDGKYFLTGIPDGSYYLMVKPNDFSRDVYKNFPPVFYPNAIKIEDAATFTISKTSKLENFDIHFPKDHPLKSVKGKVFYADDSPAKNVQIEFYTGNKIADWNTDYQSKEDGSFVVPVLKGKKIKIFATFRIYEKNLANCPQLAEHYQPNERGWVQKTTNAAKISVKSDIEGIELKFPFTPCK